MKHTLITIEGTDGSGKKTQTQKLYEYLRSQKRDVVIISFPNYDSLSSGPVRIYLGGVFGEKGNCLDAYQASSLFAVDRLCTMKQIYNKLETDTIIIFDRYSQSNMIHQAGKITDKIQLDAFLNWLDHFEFETLKLPRVDKVIFLDVPVDISYKISTAREQMKIGEAFTYDIHERDKQHLTDAYRAAKHVAKRFDWKIIPCTTKKGELKTIDEIHELIKAEVKKIL